MKTHGSSSRMRKKIATAELKIKAAEVEQEKIMDAADTRIHFEELKI